MGLHFETKQLVTECFFFFFCPLLKLNTSFFSSSPPPSNMLFNSNTLCNILSWLIFLCQQVRGWKRKKKKGMFFFLKKRFYGCV